MDIGSDACDRTQCVAMRKENEKMKVLSVLREASNKKLFDRCFELEKENTDLKIRLKSCHEVLEIGAAHIAQLQRTIATNGTK